jgi:polar amino acid transport system substrate-binding protein
MRIKRLILLIVLLVLTGKVLAQGGQIKVCAADVDYPPFLFADGTGARSTGLAVDILQWTMARLGRPPAAIDRLPWLRCLDAVATGRLDMVVNVPTAEIDPTPYWITEPYFEVHSVYYFSTKARPAGIDIRNLEQLKHFNVCGLAGNRYDAFGIDTAKVDTGARTYTALVRKLDAGFCDLFLEKREVIDSLMARNADLRLQLSSPGLQRRDLPEELPSGLHFAISRHLQGGDALQRAINDALHSLHGSKELERLQQPYLR